MCNAVIIFQRVTIVCRVANVAIVRRSVLAVRAEPTTAVHTASITGSDPQTIAKSATPTTISFDALSGIISHSTARMCSLETARVHGENHGKRERNGQGGCGHVKSKPLTVMRKPNRQQVPRVLKRSLKFNMTKTLACRQRPRWRSQKMSIACTRIKNEPLSTSLLGNEKEPNVLKSILNKIDGASFNQIANETNMVSLCWNTGST